MRESRPAIVHQRCEQRILSGKVICGRAVDGRSRGVLNEVMVSRVKRAGEIWTGGAAGDCIVGSDCVLEVGRACPRFVIAAAAVTVTDKAAIAGVACLIAGYGNVSQRERAGIVDTAAGSGDTIWARPSGSR